MHYSLWKTALNAGNPPAGIKWEDFWLDERDFEAERDVLALKEADTMQTDAETKCLEYALSINIKLAELPEWENRPAYRANLYRVEQGGKHVKVEG